MKVNHYGMTVDSDSPVTGVISSNSISWECMDEEHCLTCEEIFEEIENDDSLTLEEKQEEIESVECDSSHDKIVGEWLKDSDGKYYPNPEGEYAAIIRESVIQVVYSKHIAYNRALCSPCYVGQVDLDSEGQFMGYTLPPEMIYNPEIEA